ncbi:hypothetical protein [Listeria ilorinensis]|uniref:hypothetical protein n=1 Tax=Listeria ilorinensis TaxID=2867439 RepID=UPI001EF56710|nr:hypothetical protein [Listeria ilorinensis]
MSFDKIKRPEITEDVSTSKTTDLQEIFMEQLAKVQESGLIEKSIKEQIESTFALSIRSLFGPYSVFSKGLEQALNEAFKVDLRSLHLDSYVEMTNEIIKTTVSEKEKEVAERIQNSVNALLNGPREIKLSEIVADFIEQHRDSIIFEYDDPDREIELSIDDDDECFGHVDISFDKDGAGEIESLSIHYSKLNGGTEIYNITVENYRQLVNGQTALTASDFEKRLYGYITARTNLIIDESDVPEEIENPDYID